MTVPWRILTQDQGDGYVFRAEADEDLVGIGCSVKSGEMTLAAALEACKPYAEFWDPHQEADSDEDLQATFEFICDDPEFGPATAAFERVAADLKIPGVAFVGTENFSPATGDPWVEVHGEKALATLREKLRGRYEIIEGSW